MLSFAFITANTGHCCEISRQHVSDDVVRVLTPLARKGHGDIQGFGFRCFRRDTAKGEAYTIDYSIDGIPVSVGTLCWSQSRGWWEHLRRTCGLAGVDIGEEPPEAPWLAVLLLPSFGALTADTMMALADFEKCLAMVLLSMETAVSMN